MFQDVGLDAPDPTPAPSRKGKGNAPCNTFAPPALEADAPDIPEFP